MKKIIFSFDDALSDFYTNVFPILKKYKIKATLNVITGFSDGTIETNYDCCSIEQLRELADYGIELSNHSDKHSSPETINGYDIAQKKLKEWFPNHKIYGVVTPYTQSVPDEFYDWCLGNGIKYVRFGDDAPISKIQRLLIRFHLISARRIYYLNNTRYNRHKKIKIVYSIPISANKSVDYYKEIIKTSTLNPVITFMFHSILDTNEEIKNAQYPDGAWTTSKFEELVKWIIHNRYKICRQSDTL